MGPCKLVRKVKHKIIHPAWFQKEGENEFVVLEIRMMVGFEEMGGAQGGFWVLVMIHFWFLVAQVRSHLKFYYRALMMSISVYMSDFSHRLHFKISSLVDFNVGTTGLV